MTLYICLAGLSGIACSLNPCFLIDFLSGWSLHCWKWGTEVPYNYYIALNFSFNSVNTLHTEVLDCWTRCGPGLQEEAHQPVPSWNRPTDLSVSCDSQVAVIWLQPLLASVQEPLEVSPLYLVWLQVLKMPCNLILVLHSCSQGAVPTTQRPGGRPTHPRVRRPWNGSWSSVWKPQLFIRGFPFGWTLRHGIDYGVEDRRNEIIMNGLL